jgi:hypothetical protein
MINRGNLSIGDVKRGNTDIQKVFRGTVLIWERQTVLLLAGKASYAYMSSEAACSATEGEMENVYTSNGSFDIGNKVYWNQGATTILIDAYYKTSLGNVIRIVNSVITDNNVYCDINTPPPTGGGSGGGGGGGGDEMLEP